MNTELYQQYAVTLYGNGCCIVTRRMLRVRAVELAEIDGRQPHEASKIDWEQAKREFSDGGQSSARESLAIAG
jgi:hypothetical protein